MALPTTVTNRAELNEHVSQTGMEFAVQTGHALRTGFYLTNSGNATMTMSISTQNVYDAFDIISGINESISINAGTTKFIPFDFYGYKPISGPYLSDISGPAGTGSYNTYLDLRFSSEQDGRNDPAGTIRVYLTGYVTGYYQRNGVEFKPSHPSGFLVLKNEYGTNGFPKNTLYWQHPETGYYFDKYQIQYSDDHTSTWNDLTTLEFEQIRSTTTIKGVSFETFLYGTPTGLVGNQTYSHENLDFQTDYYYRIRGEHYDGLTRSDLISYSDWVYGYPVEDFEQNITNNDIKTGLVTGSTTLLDNTINPDGIINCETSEKGAFKIYFKNLEENINLKSKFDEEIEKRGINLNAFDPLSPSTHSFTGVHFINPKNYIVGSTDSTKAGIETGDKIVDSSNNEIKTVLFLEKGSVVAGKGGAGGNGGYIKITDVNVNGDDRYITINEGGVAQFGLSTVGENGTDAIKITDSTINEFQIQADNTARIYGGGGGGGGGDTTYLIPILEAIELNKFKNLNIEGNEISLDLINNVIASRVGGSSDNGFFYTELFNFSNIKIEKKDLMGIHNAGVGGGGMTFLKSSGGKFVYNNYFPVDSFGSFYRPGIGTKINLLNKMSSGGNGGYFGEDGNSPEDFWLRGFQTINGRIGETNSFKGGYAGYAINALNNTNYSEANFRTKLFFIKKYTEPSNINGFLCRWSANDLTYNNYSTTTLATNGQKIQRWNSVEYNSNLINQPYIQGSNGNLNDSRSPSWIESEEYFNENSCVHFHDYQYAYFKNLVDNTLTDALLINNDIKEFDIFYNIYPSSDTSPQFNSSSRAHENFDYVLHVWSTPAQYKQVQIGVTRRQIFLPYFYNKDGFITESLGLGLDNLTKAKDFSYGRNQNSNLKNFSFVYNIASKRRSSGIVEYKMYSNNKLIGNSLTRSPSFDFIDEPVLGSVHDLTLGGVYLGAIDLWPNSIASLWDYGANKKTSFKISDILIFTRRLNSIERDNVSSYLNSKNRKIKTINKANLDLILAQKSLTKDKIYEPDKNFYTDDLNVVGYVATEN